MVVFCYMRIYTYIHIYLHCSALNISYLNIIVNYIIFIIIIIIMSYVESIQYIRYTVGGLCGL